MIMMIKSSHQYPALLQQWSSLGIFLSEGQNNYTKVKRNAKKRWRKCIMQNLEQLGVNEELLQDRSEWRSASRMSNFIKEWAKQTYKENKAYNEEES